MGCFTFVKVMMILFNFIIFLAGAALLAVGVWVSVDGSAFLAVMAPFRTEALLFFNVGYSCIAAGAVLVLLSIVGCCGAQKESKCLLIAFFSILMLVFVAEVAAAVVTLFYSSMAEHVLTATVRPVLQKYYGKDPKVTNMWNSIMTELNCCGFNNYTDFDFTNSSQRGDSYPATCCSASSANSSANSSAISSANSSAISSANSSANCSQQAAFQSNVSGCFELVSTIKRDANIVGGITAGVCGIEMAAMFVSMYLYWHLDNPKT
ncbi:tetraspanin-1 [Anguilla anguilla]|uniref:tetraspanin-1 n=1 Tax=Anguilla anguilla TaxID=7936 RepID=UPI0015A9A8EB|nr:tetraspanin-1 [Anguilla anguilla]